MLHLLRVEMVINSPWIMPILGTKELASPEQTTPGSKDLSKVGSNRLLTRFVASDKEDTHEPLTYQEATACEDSSKWKIKEGIKGVQKLRYKARLVGRGFTQRADDMLIACKSKAEIGSTKSLLKKEFNMKELGEANKILGMEIVRDQSRKILRVSQSGHFKLSLKDCSVRDCDVEKMSKVSYANAVGILMYLMVCTRPNIVYAVRGYVVSWKAMLQHVVALSTTEAEEVLEAKTVKVLNVGTEHNIVDALMKVVNNGDHQPFLIIVGGKRKEFLDSKVALAQAVECNEICYIQSRRKYRYSNREGCCKQQDSKQRNIDFLFSVENATASAAEVHQDTTCPRSYVLGDLGEPANYKAALLDPEFEKWLNAMNVEIQSMKYNEVWVLVELPPNGKTVGSKWLFKKKTDIDRNVHIYKARFVAKGYTQTPGIDYEETFSPVADIRALRSLIATAAYYDYEIWQMDVKTAFLNGYLNEEVYMEQPEGFVNPNYPNRVCEAAYILGIKIYRDRSKRLIGLCQSAYIEKILKRYCMENSKRGSIPMHEKLKLSKSQGASTPAEMKRMQNVPYASATGYVFVLNGGAVDWKSSKQSIFATSSAETKYIAAFDASNEAVWVRKFIYGLRVVPIIEEPISMYCDNTEAIAIANES
nr:retrotransposon protein, putative, Ty1-copia subclass [Tanacetum cinerariifolium]